MEVPELNDRFLGEDGRGEGYFSVDEWIHFQRRLVTADTVMHSLAPETGARVIGNLRGEWPARGLRLRKGARIGEVRVELNPKYLEERIERYELRSLVIFEPIPIGWSELQESRVTATFEVDEMDNRPKLTRCIEEETHRLRDLLQ
jgi:hypothetical protein